VRRPLLGPARLDLLLAVVAVALIAVAAVLFLRGGQSDEQKAAGQYAEIVKAAKQETIAFLTIDHTKMDDITDAVLDGATGEFKKEYTTSLDSLKDAAKQQESFATGTVDEAGVSEADADSATVFVSAASDVRNKGTDGKTETRAWRIKLTMNREGDRWLVSKLEFVS